MMIAEAAQRYGFVVRDGAPNLSIYAQDPTPTGTNPNAARRAASKGARRANCSPDSRGAAFSCSRWNCTRFGSARRGSQAHRVDASGGTSRPTLAPRAQRLQELTEARAIALVHPSGDDEHRHERERAGD
jgi:hypothetical protein